MKLPTFRPLHTAVTLTAVSIAFTAALAGCQQVGEAVNGAVSEVHLPQKTIQPVAALPDQSHAVYADYQTLSKYHWRLGDATMQGAPLQVYQDIIKNQQGSLAFSSDNGTQRYGYTFGCNSAGGEYQLELGKVAFTGDAFSTLIHCGDLTNAENRFAHDLDGSLLTLKIDETNFTAEMTQSKGGLVMHWQGVMKPEVRYGKPVQLYWEIAPEKVACVDDAGNDQLCLKVRNVNYDEQGIKTGAGAWRNFDGQIDGFKFDPNIRQIIRLNAFNNPNGEPNPYYVFDQMVESEVIR